MSLRLKSLFLWRRIIRAERPSQIQQPPISSQSLSILRSHSFQLPRPRPICWLCKSYAWVRACWHLALPAILLTNGLEHSVRPVLPFRFHVLPVCLALLSGWQRAPPTSLLRQWIEDRDLWWQPKTPPVFLIYGWNMLNATGLVCVWIEPPKSTLYLVEVLLLSIPIIIQYF